MMMRAHDAVRKDTHFHFCMTRDVISQGRHIARQLSGKIASLPWHIPSARARAATSPHTIAYGLGPLMLIAYGLRAAHLHLL